MPVPEPDEIVSHDWSAVAVHVRVWSVAETKMVPLPPGESTVTLLGLRVIRGEEFASWLTVKVCPTPPSGATAIVAVRVELPVFGAALHPTDPPPVPLDPEVTDSHVESLLTAVHCRKASSVFTVTVPLLPFWPALEDDGLILRLPPA